ncbi:MAG: hypothetical protein JWO84_662 [Parcubacteria group bacterium]|nr:hypothetical protein [Parcubacteria group bacterium]
MVQKALNLLANTPEVLIREAAQWTQERFGRRIKEQDIRRAITRLKHWRTVVDWVASYCRTVTRRQQVAQPA